MEAEAGVDCRGRAPGNTGRRRGCSGIGDPSTSAARQPPQPLPWRTSEIEVWLRGAVGEPGRRPSLLLQPLIRLLVVKLVSLHRRMPGHRKIRFADGLDLSWRFLGTA